MQRSEKYLSTRADYNAVQPPFSFHPMAQEWHSSFPTSSSGERDEDDDVGLCQLFLLESRMLPPNKNPSLFFPSLLYFITQTPEESKAASAPPSVRPGMLQHLSLDQQHSIAAGAARTAGRVARPSIPPSSPSAAHSRTH